MTSISDLKARQAAKMREIGEALVAAGYDNLDDQAAALGLSRSTTWTILRGAHKGGLSAATLNRMLSAPDLHSLVRRKVLEYIAEKSAGRYGSPQNCLQRFNQRLAGEGIPQSQRAVMNFHGVLILSVVCGVVMIRLASIFFFVA